MNNDPIVLGWHWFIDLSRCTKMPTTAQQLEVILVATAKLAGATIVDRSFHEFSPYGLSGVVVISESHLAAHTWPEHHAACIDLFSCTAELDIQRAADYLAEAFGAEKLEIRCQKRSISREN